MKRSVAAEIFASTFAALTLATLFLLPLWLILLRAATQHWEQVLYARVASRVAEQVVIREAENGSVADLFHDVARINPDLEPYLLDSAGRVVLARSNAAIGLTVPIMPQPEGSSELTERGTCGADPLVPGRCVAYSIATIGRGISARYLYLPVTHGLAVFFASPAGWWWAVAAFLPGMLLALGGVGILALFVAQSLTNDLRGLSNCIERITAGELSARFAGRGDDEVARAGTAANALAATLSLRTTQLKETYLERAYLFGALVHDLRRPVSVLRLLFDRLASKRPPAPNLHEIDQALAAEQLLLDGLPQLTGAEDAPPQGAEGEYVQLGDVLHRCAAELRVAFEEKGVLLSVQTDSSADAIPGSYRNLYQCVLNLLDNALRYTPAGGTVIGRYRSTGEIAILEVEDTGMGIPPAEQEKVFLPYYRTSAAAAAVPNGSGIGLSTVRRIVRSHNGALQLESQSGVGSRFTCAFPLHADWTIGGLTGRLPLTAGLASVESFTGGEGHPRSIGPFMPGICSALLIALNNFSLAPRFAVIECTLLGLSLAIAGAFELASRRQPGRHSRAGAFRAVLLAVFFAQWVVLGFALPAHETSRFTLIFAAVSGLLFSMSPGRHLPPTVNHVRAILRSVSLAALLLWRANWKEALLCGVCLLAGRYFQRIVEVPRSARLAVKIRNLALLLLLFSVTVQGALLGAEQYRVVFDGRTLLTNELVENIAAVLRSRLVQDPPPPAVEQAIFEVGWINPRVDLHALCGDAMCGASPVRHEADRFLQMEGQPPLTPNRHRRIELLAGTASSSPVALDLVAESDSSKAALRKTGERYLAAFFLLSLFTLMPIGWLLQRRLNRQIGIRLQELSTELETLRRAQASPVILDCSTDEIGVIRRALPLLAESAHRSSALLHAADERTRQLINLLVESLQDHLNRLRDASQRLTNADSLNSSLNELREWNDGQADALEEITALAQLEQGRAVLSQDTFSMDDLCSEILLSCGTGARAGMKGVSVSRNFTRAAMFTGNIEQLADALLTLLGGIPEEQHSVQRIEVRSDTEENSSPSTPSYTLVCELAPAGAHPHTAQRTPQQRIHELLSSALLAAHGFFVEGDIPEALWAGPSSKEAPVGATLTVRYHRPAP